MCKKREATSFKEKQEVMSLAEWQALPIGITADEVARAGRMSLRHVQRIAPELGGTLVAGRWLFSKSKIAELFGLGDLDN